MSCKTNTSQDMFVQTTQVPSKLYWGYRQVSCKVYRHIDSAINNFDHRDPIFTLRAREWIIPKTGSGTQPGPSTTESRRSEGMRLFGNNPRITLR
ncbi:hypothetical protein J6590_063859 [Homalodisca vitripennis]|nr:hypothetical protein J6590_063859 [Homalodisca vitripennis]